MAPISDRLPIILRTYVPLPTKPRRKAIELPPAPTPSDFILVFDVETSNGPEQELRFGSWILARGSEILRRGLFHGYMSNKDRAILKKAAWENDFLEIISVQDFIHVYLLPLGVDDRATIVGANLAFDISRIAISHSPARKNMKGGFSFVLSKNRNEPRIRIKHISRYVSFMGFNGGLRQYGFTKPSKENRMSNYDGFFVDVLSLAHTLYDFKGGLSALGKFLKIPHPKFDIDEENHGKELSVDYVEYNLRDTLATFECYLRLKEEYERLGVSVPINKLHSGAAIAKGVFKEAGIKPWHEVQPDFPPEIIGKILSTYYGGRAESHIRHEPSLIIATDTTSMYPSVVTLMGLDRFLIAKGIWHEDATEGVRQLLARTALDGCNKADLWTSLPVIVKVLPRGDVLTFRTNYSGQRNNIARNELTCRKPIWVTLADCIVSKLMTGNPIEVVEAIRFFPVGVQEGVKPVAIAGDKGHPIDPKNGRFFAEMIERRIAVKNERDKREEGSPEYKLLDARQKVLKTVALGGCYGVFIELLTEKLCRPEQRTCYSGDDVWDTTTQVEERPGKWFHPLIATLETAGARLILAMIELKAKGLGLDWVACDTDSMFFTPAEPMPHDEFVSRVKQVQGWLEPLNPYRGAEDPLLKIEPVNFSLSEPGKIEPLYCLAMRAKCYALYNRGEDGKPVLRKVSMHGLGAYVPPYGSNRWSDPHSCSDKRIDPSIPEPVTAQMVLAPYVGKPLVAYKQEELNEKALAALHNIAGQRWHYDIWYKIVECFENGAGVVAYLEWLESRPEFRVPAARPYTANTTAVLEWFDRYNENRPYRQQVRPFGFMLSFSYEEPDDDDDEGAEGAAIDCNSRKPVATYSREVWKAARRAFDREPGQKEVDYGSLCTYADVLRRHVLRPEWKFIGDKGVLQTRHVEATGLSHIGKESNRLEEQVFLGDDPKAVSRYGEQEFASDEDAQQQTRDKLKFLIGRLGKRGTARTAGLSLSRICNVNVTQFSSEECERIAAL